MCRLKHPCSNLQCNKLKSEGVTKKLISRERKVVATLAEVVGIMQKGNTMEL